MRGFLPVMVLVSVFRRLAVSQLLLVQDNKK